MLNRKLLEKQRVENCFAAYEVHIHFTVNATVRVENHLTLSIFRFNRTDKQTDNCLTPCAGVYRVITPTVSEDGCVVSPV